MLGLLSCLLVLSTALVAGQRGSFAGFRPIGYPDTPNRTTTTPDPLANRNGTCTPPDGKWNTAHGHQQSTKADCRCTAAAEDYDVMPHMPEISGPDLTTNTPPDGKWSIAHGHQQSTKADCRCVAAVEDYGVMPHMPVISGPDLITKPEHSSFGEDSPQRLPVEANGDWDLVDRLSKLPVDKQPFWFINWQQLEEQRKNPQTYPQRPSSFVDPTSNQGTNGQGFIINNNQGTPSSGFANNPNVANINPIVTNDNPSITNLNPVVTNNNPSQTNNGFGNNNPSLININPILTNPNPVIANNKPVPPTTQDGFIYSIILPNVDNNNNKEAVKNNSISSNNRRVPNNNAGLPQSNNNKDIPSNNVRNPTTAVYSVVDTSISNNNNLPVNSQNINKGFLSQSIPNNQRVPINFLGLPIQNNRGRPNSNEPIAFSFASTQYPDNNGPRDSYGNPINNGYTNPNIELSYPNPYTTSDLANKKEVNTRIPVILQKNPALLNSRPELISPGLVSHAISSNPSQGTIKTEFSTSSPTLPTFNIPPFNVSTSNNNSKLVNTNTGFVDPNTGLSVDNKDSTFTSSSSSFASSSSVGDRFGDDPTSVPSYNYNYNYNWNNAFNHQFMTFFRINSTHAPQKEFRYNNNQPRYY